MAERAYYPDLQIDARWKVAVQAKKIAASALAAIANGEKIQ
jgi:hypothetical protein